MGNKNELRDVFISTMFKKSSLDSPSENFTSNIMSKIQQDSVSVIDDSPIIGVKYWILIGLSFVAAAFVIFSSDFSLIENLFSGIGNSISLEGFSFNILGSLKQAIALVKIPPIVIIGLLAVALLVVLDRFLKLKFNANLLIL
jgi:hypothetical protein